MSRVQIENQLLSDQCLLLLKFEGVNDHTLEANQLKSATNLSHRFLPEGERVRLSTNF